MAERTLKLIATFNDAGALSGLKVLNAELGKTETTSKKTQTGFQKFGQQLSSVVGTVGMVTGAVGLATVALGQMYNQAKQGAELELAEERFDNLAESIDTTAESILTKMGAATSGMMSNAEMIASASQIISLGLADTEEGVVDLASLIGQLGWDMTQVIMTFANNSKMRLDALGLSVEDVTNRAAALEAQGYSMDKAFDMAVIEAGKAKLELLGSAADSDVGSFARLEAWWKNVTNSAKQAVSEGLTPAIDAFILLATWTEKTNDVRATNIEQTGSQYEQYAAQAIQAALANKELSESEANLILKWLNGEQVLAENMSFIQARMDEAGILTEGEYQLAAATEQTNEQMAMRASVTEQVALVEYEWAENIFYANQALELQTDSTYTAYVTSEKFADRLALVNEKAALMTETMQNAVPSIDEMRDALNQDISSPLDDFIQDIEFFVAGGGRDFVAEFQNIQENLAEAMVAPGDDAFALQQAKEDAAGLLVEIEKVKIAMGEKTEFEAAQGLADSLGVPLEDALQLLKDFDAAADEVFGEDRNLAINQESLDDLHQKLKEAEGAINNLEGEHEVVINITTNGSIPSAPGSNGAPAGQGGSQGFASGTDSFTVPTGYPNDSYLVGLTSGEEFSVKTPAQQLRQAFGTFHEGGGDIYNITIMQMPGENAEALARRVVQILQEKNRR